MKCFRILVFLLFGLSSNVLLAQPVNDDCDNATNLPNVANWCSTQAQFNNAGATPSGFQAPVCWGQSRDDVWFSFNSIATDVTITVIGATPNGAGGTLRNPQVVLYQANDCGSTLNEQECATDAQGANVIELYKGGLVVGQNYLIRIQGSNNGSFQLCVNNYNPPVNPGSDCVSASVLCDTSPFTVQSVVGAGNDPDEAGTSSCLGGFGGNSETNSTWFVWTADAEEPGVLEFTLSPTNPSDDLDFVLFELTDGIGNCNAKTELRCMATGIDPSLFPSRCAGPTGLRAGETDNAEPPGCNNPSQNSFLAPLEMEAGKSYGLLINNFTATGNGFSIEFGGTGKFQGPVADFTSDATGSVCYGQDVNFTDASTFPLGELTNWQWSFGVDAVPATATGQNPPVVQWTSPGLKSVVLTVETDLGCIVTEIETILVEPCCEDVNAMTITPNITDALCPDIADGAIVLDVTSNAPPYTYLWEDGSTDNSISNLIPGDYMVTITNAATCDTVLTYTVATADPIVVDTLIRMPTCDGGTDGAITLNVTGVGPFEFNWNDGNGFVEGNNTLDNLPIGTYDVSIRDANGCVLPLSIFVNELVLELDPTIEAVTPPSCFGFSDGSIVLSIANGLAPFEFDWNDGRGFVGSNSLENIAAGNYNIIVRDANNCQGFFNFVVEDYDPVEVEIEVIDVSCFGEGDGQLIAHATGGVGDYMFVWSNNGRDSIISDLEPGNYSVRVIDGNGCEVRDMANIEQPEELSLDVVDIQDVLCNGDGTGQVSLMAIGGNPPFEYSVDGVFFQPDPIFPGLLAGDYTFVVRDPLGCTSEVDATVAEPLPLLVDAGPDQRVELGFTAVINTTTSPPLRPVTYQWAGSDSLTLSCEDCPNPIASPFSTSTYQVIITDEDGCTAIDNVTIEVIKNRPIFIPNAFSPNDDGENDFFTAFGGPAAQRIRTLQVFDRWGALMFETSNLDLGQESLGWDGRYRGQRVPPGVFVYVMEIEFIDGEVLTFKGDISVIR